MELYYTELDNGIRLIKLTGKLDVSGMSKFETEFANYCAAEGARVLVDLSEVDELTSPSIGLLTSIAQSLASRRGRMVLLGASGNVKNMLEGANIPSIIPMYEGLESAEAVLLAS